MNGIHDENYKTGCSCYWCKQQREKNPLTSIMNDPFEFEFEEYNLTNKEVVVLRLIMEDNSNQEIAYLTSTAIGTIRKHISNIFKKMDVYSRTGAAIKAMVDKRWLE